MIYIQNKLLRIVAGCLLLGGMASIFAYSYAVVSSGDIVAEVQSVEAVPYESRIAYYDSIFQKARFQRMRFPDVPLTPEMGELKLELIVKGTEDSSDHAHGQSRYNLLAPVFSFVHSATNEVVFEEKIETERGSYHYHSNTFEESAGTI